jgi:hypothetical protein
MQVSNVQCVVDNGTILVSMDHAKGKYRTKFGRRNNLLLAWEGNRKIEKSKGGELSATGSLSFFPHKLPSLGNACPAAVSGCISGCVSHNGNGIIPGVQLARIARRVAFSQAREAFLELLRWELERANSIARKQGKAFGCRLNTFSDYPWESIFDLSHYDRLRFYDYTKLQKRLSDLNPMVQSNYRLCFSWSGQESQTDFAQRYLSHGGTVAVVFADRKNRGITRFAYNQGLPEEFLGYRVVDGDKTDNRFHDESGVVVGLRIKARSWAQYNSMVESGFAVSWN